MLVLVFCFSDGMADITELFTHSCPKFVSAAPASDDSAAHSPEWAPYTLQLKLFTAEVAQQVKESQLPTIRSYLKLYTTISTAKLASFLEVPEPTLRTYLLCFKHKTRNLVWSGGAPLSGKSTFASDVDFYLDQVGPSRTSLPFPPAIPSFCFLYDD